MNHAIWTLLALILTYAPVEARDHQVYSQQLKVDDEAIRDFEDWAQVPDAVSTQRQQEKTGNNERAYLQEFRLLIARATGSGNGGDPVALSFLQAGLDVLRSCNQLTPGVMQFLNQIHIRNVTFRLCSDDLSKCPLIESSVSKINPDLNLILVNHSRWGSLPPVSQKKVAGQSLAGLIGLELCIDTNVGRRK